MSIREELNQFLKQGRLEKPFHHPSHIILFGVENEDPQYVLCFEEQIEEAFHFLKERNVDFITISQLGRNVMTYSKDK
jgi:hypothetical protein